MKTFLLVAWLLSSISCFSQKIKDVTVCEGPYHLWKVKALITLLEGNVHGDTIFIVFSRNHQYMQTVDLIRLKSGTYTDVHQFFEYCKSFLEKEDDGTSEIYQGNSISITKMMGFKGLNIHGEDKDSKWVYRVQREIFIKASTRNG